jgi:glycosyltransferase involved in cell wall biosynthesis
MAAGLEEVLQAGAGVSARPHGRAGERVPMVVGVTSAQTCLVLSGRLRALRLAGFDVTLVASPGELLNRTAQAEGVKIFPIPMQRGIAPVADLHSLIALFRLLRRVRPMVTDFSTPKAGLLGNLAAWALRVPCRIYTLRGLKLESSRGSKRWLLIHAERVAAWCAQVVLYNSESLGTEARVLGIAPDAKLRMLGKGSSNGVDTNRFSPGKSDVRERLGIGADDVVLGFVGRLTRDKGVPELLTAFDAVLQQAPQARLLLVGWFDLAEDVLETHWRERIAGHPRIAHVGYAADTVEYYRAMDMLVLPTHREGFPNVALEAAACGLPVVTTESTGARDAVLAEVTGLLIPPRMPQAVAEAALSLIRDEEKRKRMGEAGRRWVVERFSQERVLGLAVEFYREMVEKQGSRE